MAKRTVTLASVEDEMPTNEPDLEPTDEQESKPPQMCINKVYTDVDTYLKEQWEEQQSSGEGLEQNGTTAAKCSIIVPTLKKSNYRFAHFEEYGDRITYTFKSVNAETPAETIRVCVSLHPNTFEEFADRYSSWTEDGAVYCWNDRMNIWAFDIEDDIDGNFLYVEFPVSEEPTPLSAVHDLFDFELRTYSPTAETNAVQ